MFWYALSIIQIVFCVIIVVFEKNNKKIMTYWLLLVVLLPLLGYLIYLLFGNALKINARNKIKKKFKKTKNYLKQTHWYNIYKPQLNVVLKGFRHNVYNYINTLGFNCWHISRFKLYCQSKEFIYDLKKDLLNARSSINLEFYIFADDKIGKEIANILIKKARQGVDVNLVYDAFGSHKTSNSFWNKIIDGGVNVSSFFPALLKLFNTKINYRNHRKIVVIDGKIAYTGGVNIRDDHMGGDKTVSPWRDTMLKVAGGAVFALQDIFINDYLFASNKNLTQKDVDAYFPYCKNPGNNISQIITSGPEKEKKYIKSVYLYMIKNCSKYLYIETPYFVVDKIFINQLIIAKNRGVDIKIIIPGKPDKSLVYAMSLRTINTLVKHNINVYLYKGFIHSKMLIADNIASVGSCNFDNRSFNLNFEDTVILYNKNDVKECKTLFKNDVQNSIKLNMCEYLSLTKKYKINLLVYKIFSKIV